MCGWLIGVRVIGVAGCDDDDGDGDGDGDGDVYGDVYDDNRSLLFVSLQILLDFRPFEQISVFRKLIGKLVKRPF